jgi:hypothetical protein
MAVANTLANDDMSVKRFIVKAPGVDSNRYKPKGNSTFIG